MRVSEDPMDEIYEERAQYLINVDELLFEMYSSEVHEKRVIPALAFYSGFGEIDTGQNFMVSDRLFASKEYKKFIELTRPEKFSKIHDKLTN